MKYLVVLIFFFVSSNAMALTPKEEAQQNLFNVLKEIYDDYLAEDPCEEDGLGECSISIVSGQCLMNSSCYLIIEDKNYIEKLANIRGGYPEASDLYEALKEAARLNIGSVKAFGSRLRPNYRMDSMLTCESNPANEVKCY